MRVATTNPGKAAEFRRLLAAALGHAGEELTVVGPEDLRLGPVVEDGETYQANAERKARAVAAADPTAAVLAEDSGVEVDVLGGAPGLLSARWAVGEGGRPLDGTGLNAALLERLAGVPGGRRARMVASVWLLLPDGSSSSGWGQVRGEIATDQRGAGGFGYDAVFLLPDGRRLSEVAPEVKDRLGHRGQAVRAVVPALRRWLALRQTSR